MEDVSLWEAVKRDGEESPDMETHQNQGKKRLHGEKGEVEEASQKIDVPSSASNQLRVEVTFEERGQVQGVVL